MRRRRWPCIRGPGPAAERGGGEDLSRLRARSSVYILGPGPAAFRTDPACARARAGLQLREREAGREIKREGGCEGGRERERREERGERRERDGKAWRGMDTGARSHERRLGAGRDVGVRVGLTPVKWKTGLGRAGGRERTSVHLRNRRGGGTGRDLGGEECSQRRRQGRAK